MRLSLTFFRIPLASRLGIAYNRGWRTGRRGERNGYGKADRGIDHHGRLHVWGGHAQSQILQAALGTDVRIEYPELQKSISGRYGSKGVRLDAYVEDDAGTVYDVEIQTAEKKSLPKRARYYQSLIDLHILEKGEDYAALRKSFVIFICTYDPFGKGRYVYTFESLCREDTGVALGDEAAKVILNAKGHVGEISAELKALLRYMDGFAPEDDYTRELDGIVAEIRSVSIWY